MTQNAIATNYTQGYSKATLGSHGSRTITSDAAFLLPFLKPSDRILDVGCGSGSITAGFSSQVPHGTVLGVDIAEEVLEDARRSLPATATNVTFQAANLLAGLPFSDASFDVVFSSQLFPHLTTTAMKLAALTEMRRVLKEGGILATRDAAELHFYPRKYNLDVLWTVNTRRAHNYGGDLSDEEKGFPGGAMPALIRQVGFDPSSIRVGAGTTVHSGAEVRNRYAAGNLGRLDEGDSFRKSWKKVGISVQEIDETKDAIKRWAADQDAWYVALQAEIVAQK